MSRCYFLIKMNTDTRHHERVRIHGPSSLTKATIQGTSLKRNSKTHSLQPSMQFLQHDWLPVIKHRDFFHLNALKPFDTANHLSKNHFTLHIIMISIQLPEGVTERYKDEIRAS